MKAAKAELQSDAYRVERLVGRCGGFNLGVCGQRGGDVPALYLEGACRYDAEPYQTAPGLVNALLATLASVGEQQAKAADQLAVKRKRLEDLQLELARPFEHERKLTELLVRQRELLKQLELDKDEAGTSRTDTDAERQAA